MVGLAVLVGACADASPEGTTPATEPAAIVSLAAPGATTAAAAPPSQSPADATRDGIVPEIAALPLEQRAPRIPAGAGAGRIETPEGAWVISTPSPEHVDQFSEIGDAAGVYGKDYVDLGEYAEILLLHSETGEILKAFPFPAFPPTSLALFDDGLYCARPEYEWGPGSMLCRVNRHTLAATVRVFLAYSDADLHDYAWFPGNWTVDDGVPPSLDDSGELPDNLDPLTLEVYPEAWAGAEAERHVENYLAALAAGAYEAAAAARAGVRAADQWRVETVAEYLARRCDGGLCAGPYEVEADGPGYGRSFGRAGSTVTVVHTESGEAGVIRLESFDGRLAVTDLPPLIASKGGPTLVDLLFGRMPPRRVVVQRLGAFEIWESGSREWVVNRWADDTYQVEGTVAASGDWSGEATWVGELRDPETFYPLACSPQLVTRGAEVLAFEQCWADRGRLTEVTSGDARDAPVDLGPEEDEVEMLEWPWFDERGGTVVRGPRDVEGNLSELRTLDGTDLLGDRYAGITRLSIDGERLAYVDHAFPAYSPHVSPYLVVVDTESGDLVGRWMLDGVITCLELAEDWVVACEAKDDSPERPQEALVAINTATGEVNRVETRARVFLP